MDKSKQISLDEVKLILTELHGAVKAENGFPIRYVHKIISEMDPNLGVMRKYFCEEDSPIQTPAERRAFTLGMVLTYRAMTIKR